MHRWLLIALTYIIAAGSLGYKALASSPSLQPVQVYLRRAEDACVRVRHEGGFGTGFLVSSNGYLITNFHVIEGAGQIEVVTRAGQTHKVSRVEAFDRAHDLALLKIGGGPYPYLEPVTTEPRRGDPVYIFGHGQGSPWAFTQGYIVSLRDKDGRQEIQFSADISPGNSGGPVIMHESGRFCAVSTYIAWPEISPGVPDRSRAFKFGISYGDVNAMLASSRQAKSLKSLNELVTTINTACMLSRMLNDLDQAVKGCFSRPDEVVKNIPFNASGTPGYRVMVSSSFAHGADVVQTQLQLFEGRESPLTTYPIRYDSVDRSIGVMHDYLKLVFAACNDVMTMHGRWSKEAVSPRIDESRAAALALEASRYLAGMARSHKRYMYPHEQAIMQKAVDLFYRYRRGDVF